MHAKSKILAPLGLLLLLSACGTRGPLTLPPRPVAKPTTTSEQPKPAVSPTPAADNNSTAPEQTKAEQ